MVQASRRAAVSGGTRPSLAPQFNDLLTGLFNFFNFADGGETFTHCHWAEDNRIAISGSSIATSGSQPSSDSH